MVIGYTPFEYINKYIKNKKNTPYGETGDIGGGIDFTEQINELRKKILQKTVGGLDSPLLWAVKKYETDPVYAANLSAKNKAIINQVKKILPDLTKQPKPIAPSIYQQFQITPTGQRLIPEATPQSEMEKQAKTTAQKMAQVSASKIPATDQMQEMAKNIQSINQTGQPSTVKELTLTSAEGMEFTPLPPKSRADKFWAWVRKEFGASLLPILMEAANLPFKTSTEIFLKLKQEEDKYVADKLDMGYEEFRSLMEEPYNSGYMWHPKTGKFVPAYELKQEILNSWNKDNPWNTPEELNKAALEWWKQALDEPSKPPEEKTVEGTGWKDIFGYLVPEMKQDYPFVADLNDWWKGFNWLQRILGTMIPNPAALAGLVAETKAIELPKLTIGAAVGSKTAINLTTPITDASGNVLVEAGEQLNISKIGKEAIKPFVAETVQRAKAGFQNIKNTLRGGEIIPGKGTVTPAVSEADYLRQLGYDVSTPAGRKLLKDFTQEMAMTPVAYARKVAMGATESELRQLVSTLPIDDAVRLIDEGGISLFGMNILPGKVIGKLNPIAERLGETKFGRALEGMFWTNKDIPEIFRPAKAYISSAMRKESELGFSILKKIRGNLSNPEMTVFDHYVKLNRDILDIKNQITKWQDELGSGALSEAQALKLGKKIASYTELMNYGMKKLPNFEAMNDNLKTAIASYYKDFVQDFLLKREQKWGIEYNISEAYTPIRGAKSAPEYIKNLRKGVLGSEEATFMKEYGLGGYVNHMRQAENKFNIIKDLAEKGKDIVEIAKRTKSTVKEVKQYMKALDVYGTPMMKDVLPVGKASGIRILEHTTRVGRAMMIDEAKTFGKLIGQQDIPWDWVRARTINNKLIPEVSAYKFPADIAKVLARVEGTFFGDASFLNIVHFLDEATTLWKRLVLATPGYHLRNFYSDITSGFIEYGSDFFNLGYWRNAIKLKKAQLMGKKYPELLNQTIKVGGDTVKISDALNELGTSGVMGSGLQSIESAMRLQPSYFEYSPLQFSAKVGAAREDLGRIVAYLLERDAGSDMMLAAYNVKKVFFDYLDLTETERAFFKRAMPFYTWMRKNVVRQLEALITRPQQYGKLFAYIRSITGKEPEGYDFLKPEYFNEILAFVSNAVTEGGKPIIQRLNLPVEDINMLNPFNKNTWERVWSQVAPLYKIPLEAGIFGREVFSNKDLREQKPNELAPGLVQNVFQKVAAEKLRGLGIHKAPDESMYVTPLWNYMYRAIPQLYMAERALPQEKMEKTPYDIEAMTLGIKPIVWDDEKSRQSYYAQMETAVNNWIAEMNIKYGGSPDSGYVPAIDQMEKGYRQLYQESVNEKYKKLLSQKQMLDIQGASKMNKMQMSVALKPYNEEIGKIKGMNFVELMAYCQSVGVNPTLEEIKQAIQRANIQ